MDVKERISYLANNFNLKYTPNEYNYILCSKEEIIIRNFLCGCPDPIYKRSGNLKIKDRSNSLIKFLKSKDFKEMLEHEQGCVITKSALKQEIKIAKAIPNIEIRGRILKFYNRIRKIITDRLTLIYRPRKLDKVFNEVLLHEFVHILINSNDIMITDWRWNEGLVTYLSWFAFNKSKRLEKISIETKDEMLSVYHNYAHKWAILLKNVKNSVIRNRIILNKVKTING